jgi:acyl phosphate:glycerol-3-phosphate acyltransferase
VAWTQLAWAAGGYLAGTFPSTWIVARAKRATPILTAAGRRSGETDPHILMAKHLGVGWTALAATLDVVKGFVYILAAREWGHLADPWLALTGVAVVLGHSYPFYARRMAGRGLAAMAGVTLVLLPVEMTICGVLIVIGGVTRTTGLSTTVGIASVPVVAAIQGQPGSFVAMAAAILAIIMIRRLEGVGEVIKGGTRPAKAALYRCVFDSSGPPPGRGVWDEHAAGRGQEDAPRP